MREKAQGGRLLAHNSGFTMPGSPIPNDNGLLVRDRVPLSQVLQKINGVVTVASTLMPDETLTMAKIISPIPVKPIFERGEVLGTQSGSPTADQR